VTVRPLGPADLVRTEAFLDTHFGGRLHARRGELVDVLAGPGFVAESGGEPVGLLTYRREDGRSVELVAIVAAEEHRGIGTALVEALRREVAGCERVWLVTTNDNLEALRFYQRRGFRLSALRPGAVDEARRRLKPAIPEVGAFGIPLRDELELELRLS
jgi:ribosomal protein S18 acetylase RimI-like enzyme